MTRPLETPPPMREEVKGERLDLHCPFDEAQLRQSVMPGFAICPCCWEYFPLPVPETVAMSPTRALLSELARVKVLFQLRTIALVIGAPAPETRP